MRERHPRCRARATVAETAEIGNRIGTAAAGTVATDATVIVTPASDQTGEMLTVEVIEVTAAAARRTEEMRVTLIEAILVDRLVCFVSVERLPFQVN